MVNNTKLSQAEVQRCDKYDIRKTTEEWLELIEKPRDVQCLLMVIRALTEYHGSLIRLNSVNNNVVLNISRSELVSLAIDKLFTLYVDINRFFEWFSRFESKLENRDEVIGAKIKLIDKIKERNIQIELENMYDYLKFNWKFLPTETLLSDIKDIEHQIAIIKGTVGNVLDTVSGEINTNPSLDELILKFSKLVVEKQGGSIYSPQALIIEKLNDYPSINKVSLLKAIIADMQNPAKKGTPYLVIIIERLKEALEKQGLHLIMQ